MDSVRVDKWLWAARFFKTRSLAARPCELGRVQCNKQPVKPARNVRSGEFLRIRVDAHKMRTGTLWLEDDRKLIYALEKLAEANIFIDDTSSIGIAELRAKARRLQHMHGALDLVIVDYLQLMSSGNRRYDNRTQEVSAISRGLKGLAKELKVPVIALSQLSRNPENRSGKDHRPQLADLRESGSIEQDADVVAFIFREEVYKPDDPELEGIAEVIIRKQRNGPTGTVKMAFIKSSTRFENLEHEAGAVAAD
jgi:replicative DNA helicase